MGVNGLLRYFKSIEKHTDASKLKGVRVAVDGHSWVHKAIYGSGYSIVVRKDFTRCLKNILARIDVLLGFGAIITFVLDGADMPAKVKEEGDRAEYRKKALEQAYRELEEDDFDAANRRFAESLEVTPALVHKVAQVIKIRFPSVTILTAPYEADAQLAYLSKKNLVDVVITEDSDLLLFGAQKIIFKMGADYIGREVSLTDIKKSSDLDFSEFTHNQFIQCCILSGCDYIKSAKGVAVKTAHMYIQKFQNIQNTLKYLLNRSTNAVDREYVEEFERAYLAFKYQRVWCPEKKEVVSLNNFEFLKTDLVNMLHVEQKSLIEMPSSWTDEQIDKELLIKYFKKTKLSFLGPTVDSHLAELLVEGQLDPSTQKPFVNVEFVFDPRELIPDEIQALGYRRIAEKLIPSKNKPDLNLNLGSCMVNLTLDFDDVVENSELHRQSRLNEAAVLDPEQPRLLELIHKPVAGSPLLPISSAKKSKLFSPFSDLAPTGIDDSDADTGSVADPIEATLEKNKHAGSNQKGYVRARDLPRPQRSAKKGTSLLREENRQEEIFEKTQTNRKLKFLSMSGGKIKGQKDIEHEKAFFSNLHSAFE